GNVIRWERAWIISHFEPVTKQKTGDYPRSFFGEGQLIWDGAILSTFTCKGVKIAPSQISCPNQGNADVLATPASARHLSQGAVK
ncbi:MAG: hypothetical protein MSA17_06000, partial [Collinsella sp.]|nr:hypothetical protein [Collinsella sp.]